MAETGNSNRISREYLDSLLIETRYMDSSTPDISVELYGTKAASPVMTAALSHLKPGMPALAQAARQANAVISMTIVFRMESPLLMFYSNLTAFGRAGSASFALRASSSSATASSSIHQ